MLMGIEELGPLPRLKLSFVKKFSSYLILSGALLPLFLSCGKSPFLKMADASSETLLQSRELLSSRSQLLFSKSQLKMEILWPKAPSTDELSSVFLIFFNQNNEMIDPPEFTFIPTMPEMGHGTSPVIISRQGLGLYRIDELFFSMPGKWKIEIALKKDESIMERMSFELHL